MAVVRASHMGYPARTHAFAVVTALDYTLLNANPLSLVRHLYFMTNI